MGSRCKMLDEERTERNWWETSLYRNTDHQSISKCPFICIHIYRLWRATAKSFLKLIVYSLECIRLSVPLLTLAQISSIVFHHNASQSVSLDFPLFRYELFAQHINMRWERTNPLRTSNHFPQRFYQIVRNITFYVPLSFKFFLLLRRRSRLALPSWARRTLWLSIAMYHVYSILLLIHSSFGTHLIISSSAW